MCSLAAATLSIHHFNCMILFGSEYWTFFTQPCGADSSSFERTTVACAHPNRQGQRRHCCSARQTRSFFFAVLLSLLSSICVCCLQICAARVRITLVIVQTLKDSKSQRPSLQGRAWSKQVYGRTVSRFCRLRTRRSEAWTMGRPRIVSGTEWCQIALRCSRLGRSRPC